jgi:hypothetical protein
VQRTYDDGVDRQVEHENPYQATGMAVPLSRTLAIPSARALWLSFLLAPAVAPVTFIALVSLFGGGAIILGVPVNTASFLVLPLLAITVGMVVSYSVAGAVGMPVAFMLRYFGWLRGITLHGSALLGSMAASVVLAFFISWPAWEYIPLTIAYCSIGFTPPVLLTTATFWWLVQRFDSK